MLIRTSKNSIIRTYSELITIPTFIGRYQYLRLGGAVGEETFGFDRYLNQMFYTSDPWLAARDAVIIRDDGNDLGIKGRKIEGTILVHHMNPVTVDDILKARDWIIDPEYLISTVKPTHDAIHYGDESLLMTEPIERRPNDTCPWKKQY